jgi:hypothetical protein
MSEKAGETIGELLKRALFNLRQSEHFNEYMRYLNSELSRPSPSVLRTSFLSIIIAIQDHQL